MQNALPSQQRRLSSLIQPILGALIAFSIIGLWLGSLIFLLSVDISQLPFFLLIVAVLLRSFLQTGLFITAHDAIHGTIFPQNRTINNLIGLLATNLYALLPYKKLVTKHWQHHRYPASEKDPDFYNGEPQDIFLWYFKFMTGYLGGVQTWVLLIGMSTIFQILRLGFHIPSSNLILFWVLPIVFSSWQLFYFGVFLPHRRPKGGYQNCHRANSSSLSPFWSFISCYHFGYHWEHHEYPDVPWYKLSSVRQS